MSLLDNKIVRQKNRVASAKQALKNEEASLAKLTEDKKTADANRAKAKAATKAPGKYAGVKNLELRKLVKDRGLESDSLKNVDLLAALEADDLANA